MHRVAAVALLPLLTGSFVRRSTCENALARLEGYTIVKVGTIRGAFNGCDLDRLVELDDGSTVRCAEYGYQYAYSPQAIMFAKSVEFAGTKGTVAKMMVEGELYDVRSLSVR